jgi:phage shock protein C
MKRLYRSRTERMIWGICGGLANYFGVDPTWIRILAVISIFFSGAGIIAYIIMAIIVPLESPNNYISRTT